MQEFIDKPILAATIVIGIILCFAGPIYAFSLEPKDMVRMFIWGKRREWLLKHLENQA